jgi:hypothetical protein
MTRDLITRNLQDQSGNFGQETIVGNINGLRQFIDPKTGQVVSRSIAPDAYDLNNSPLDNSFQLNPQSYNFAKGLFEQPNVPENLSQTYGAIVAVTAKDQNISANRLFQNGVLSAAVLENVNFFRTAHSQIGVNDGDTTPPYANNLMLGAKIFNQTS